ncbi:MAG: family glycosyltransferase, 4-amino-4-deoxy-L-arabinose transferase [Edaphobacter sp.]|nr:family glycosyltransferase, 4-amino-4-deoxy-L-arabinose transferase [Edaphobacter sp.]
MGPLIATKTEAAALPIIRRIANSAVTSIDRYPAQAFALLSALYLFIVTALSANKLLWLDELITLHIAQLGSPTAIWRALAQAADPNPPLTHLAVLTSLRLFGDHEFALRLPAVLGYWIGLLALFLFLKRRVPPVWALAGCVLSMANAAFDYSYESRSYGIFYGLAMLAILCWSRAVDPAISSIRRNLALCGMTLSLAAGICTNYFAVLAFFPIAGGEFIRTLCLSGPLPSFSQPLFKLPPLRNFSIRIWPVLLLAATPLLAFRPLIQRSIAQFAPHAWNKVSLDQVFDSYTGMVEVILYPVVALFAMAALVSLLACLCSHCRAGMRPRWLANLANYQALSSQASFPPHEAVAVFLLMLYPFIGYLIASIHGGMLSPRFVIPVCLGFAIAGIAVGYKTLGHLRYAGIVALSLCSILFLGRVCAVGIKYRQQKNCFHQILQRIPEASGNKPIVVADALLVLTLQHYAPPSIASRIVFPVDFPAIRLHRGDDSPEENLWAGRNLVYHVPILTLADFQHNASDYLILASDGNWLVRDLWAHSYPVDRLPIRFPAGTIEGFTPLDHGDPVFFLAAGDRSHRTAPHLCPAPMPFKAAANLPSAPSLKPDRNN